MSDLGMTSEGARHEKFHIVVNGKAKDVDEKTLSFEQVVKLAYPTPPAGDVLFTVVFHNADQEPRNGTLVAGESVSIRNGTSFDVKHTVRS